jgi:hypothetical protein
VPRLVREVNVDSMDIGDPWVADLLKRAAVTIFGQADCVIEPSRHLHRPSSDLLAADLRAPTGEQARVWIKHFTGRGSAGSPKTDDDVRDIVRFSSIASERTRTMVDLHLSPVLAHDIPSRMIVTGHIEGRPLDSIVGARLLLQRSLIIQAGHTLGRGIRLFEVEPDRADHPSEASAAMVSARLQRGVERTQRLLGRAASKALEGIYSVALHKGGGIPPRRVHGDLSPSNVLIGKRGLPIGLIDPSALIRLPMYDIATLVGRLWATRSVPKRIVPHVRDALVDGYAPAPGEMHCLAIESLHRLVLMADASGSTRTPPSARESLRKALETGKAPWLPPSLAVGG